MNDIAELLTNGVTEVDDYTPTKAEEKILEVVLNPEHTGKTTTEKCQIAGISRETWYAAFRKPEFAQLVNKTAVELVKDKVADVINAVYKFAVTRPNNHQDRRILLEMAGIYHPEQNLVFNANVQNPPIDEVDLDVKLQKLLAQYKR